MAKSTDRGKSSENETDQPPSVSAAPIPHAIDSESGRQARGISMRPVSPEIVEHVIEVESRILQTVRAQEKPKSAGGQNVSKLSVIEMRFRSIRGFVFGGFEKLLEFLKLRK